MTDSLPRRIKLILDTVYKGDLGALAAAVGLDRSAVFRFTKGERNPRRSILRLLSYAANVDLDWLEHGGQTDIKFKVPEEGTILPVVQDTPPETLPAASVISRCCPACYAGKNNYWLYRKRLGEYGNDVYLLVEPVPERKLDHGDVGKLRIANDACDGPLLWKAEESDLEDGGIVTVIGIVRLIEIDNP